ncbi:hypothetical protein AQUCO_00800258v1 [Aquilegia coerulea]|uniref:Uncharacterized protein n=1 Tax=Aquilegia coerulea TaxID=218851 RepID=A0A2G5EI17_AQUCA|nr:hypothetical protein AQUCO_00800258v1 [Aquilegia coerulea]
MVNVKKEIKKLMKIKKELNSWKDDVNDKLHTAKIDRGEVPKHVVDNWLQNVQHVLNDTDRIEEEVKIATSCLKGLLPKCCSNFNLGQRISELIMEGNTLTLTCSELLKDTLTSKEPKIGVELPAQKLVGETTAQKSLEKVWELLMDGESRVVGVYGMGGIGKTKMAMAINNRILEKSNQFDKIIWVTLSKARDIPGLQIDIAKKVDLDLSNEQDEIERMGKLHEALKRRKRILFILDDMWQEFPLGEIGIPEPTTDNGCKVLITTRKKEVCNKMGCRAANVKVETLTEEEAWELFLDKVDELTPEVMPTAKLVAKECSGLPLAIITVAAAMRGNGDLGDWTVALNDLRNFSNQIIDSEDIVFERLKFSYDRLPNEKLKKSFLCCALYPEDYKILARELVDFWIMDGMVEGRSRQDELLEGQVILKKLKDHCLLETGSVGQVLPSELAGEEVLERASFMNNMISKVAISPGCPKLSTLFLGGNHFISSITHDFFIHMQCLRVLDLRCDWDKANHHLESLPDSISELVNLHDLRLSWCRKLKKVPSLAKLVLLRRLELNNTAIEELPEGMEMLGKLNCLNLHFVRLRKTIPLGLISKLSTLQELYLGGIKVDKLYDVGSGESFANELLSLEELENLNITFHCLSDYACYVGSSKFNALKCFSLAVGQQFNYRDCHLGLPPRATVQLSYSAEGSAQNALFFPKNTKRVGINCFNDLTKLNELGWLIKDVRELVAFTINKCNKIECIWWWSSSEDEKEEELSLSGTGTGTGTSSTCWLQYLERIDIYECPKLYTFFKGIPIPPFFFCLKVLYIFDCHNLKNVLSSSRLSQLLQNLEEIRVGRCDELEELIGEEEEENRRNVETPIAVQFPKIKKLGFQNVPKLKSIWRGVMICDSLEKVWVENCSELKKLSQFKGEDQSIQPPASLEEIYGTRKWWDSLEWDPAYPQNILQPFFIEL